MTQVCRSPSVLFPPFLVELQKGIDRARKAGYAIEIFETYRSPVRQDALYAQGRSTTGRIVTRSKGWESWHQYGVAADIALKIEGKWSWDFSPGIVAQHFKEVTWGGETDGPHYQWKKLPRIEEAKAIVEKEGVLAFWLKLMG